MKIAVSSPGKDLDSQIDPRFGLAAYILIVDTKKPLEEGMRQIISHDYALLSPQTTPVIKRRSM